MIPKSGNRFSESIMLKLADDCAANMTAGASVALLRRVPERPMFLTRGVWAIKATRRTP
jgi:hypothetical protein